MSDELWCLYRHQRARSACTKVCHVRIESDMIRPTKARHTWSPSSAWESPVVSVVSITTTASVRAYGRAPNVFKAERGSLWGLVRPCSEYLESCENSFLEGEVSQRFLTTHTHTHSRKILPPTHSPTHELTALTPPLAALTLSLTALTHARTHSRTHARTHSLTHEHTPSQTPSHELTHK